VPRYALRPPLVDDVLGRTHTERVGLLMQDFGWTIESID
jgi:hypothetical protein